MATADSRSLPAESVRRYGQGFYWSVSVKSLKQRGRVIGMGWEETATFDGSGAFVVSDGQ